MHSVMRKFARVVVMAVAGMTVGSVAQAQEKYPTRPITLVVGYAAGGATDIVARLVAKSLSDTLSQPVVVENRPGANSNIGAEAVARAKPDGYTLYVGSIANTINRTLYEKLNYDIKKDFTPVALLATIPNVLVVHPKLPINSVKEYIAYAKQHPGKLTCASSGSGSSIHLSCEIFKLETGTDILHVPYRGSGPAVADLLGGQVDSMFDNLPSSLPQVQAGKLRVLGVTSLERVPFVPDVPTLAESGLPGFSVQSWFAVMAPAGTPANIVETLNAAINKGLQGEALREAYEKGGFVSPAQPNTPATLQKFVDEEIDKWGKVVTSAGLKVQ
ncbi:tripartite tricarboxylate transporter substrate binding protein [Bordetella sp. 15P40C-2]|uniref:Bug family tripartite tricarboxylate transporter substrate binding protein n=1 Tax=Bordetella sp. 15P40C-2 TaxID=2572246 RepID=UPI0013234601|nr:tripartite tricarboxylate transporter substrate binding protein [Bordetella sp. 15P40C-2]